MATPEITAEQLFDGMPATFDATKAANVTVTYQIELSGEGGGTWFVKIADGAITVGKGTIENPTTTIIADAQTFVGLSLGKVNPTMAFMQGKVKIKGDMGMAMRLQSFFKRS
jgi:putative sterol carrier protein